jgi:hypothetical protein
VATDQRGKVENFRNSAIFWPHAGTYCPNLSIK